jgi:DNA-binding MarR family transcriptional regulator
MKTERTSSSGGSKKFYRKSLTLLRLILKLIGDGYYPTKIARVVGRSRQTVHYHVKKLEEMGYVEVAAKDAIVIYRVTQAGQKFLDGIERRVVRGRRLRLHNVVFKYRVLGGPSRAVDWGRVVGLRNWGQLVGCELGLTVRKNPDSVEVFCGVLEGDDPYELLFRAREEADRVAGFLEEKFGLVLGRGVLSRRPHFGVYDAFAGKFSGNFQLSDDVAKIDESEGYGEIDWLDPEAAKSYLLMPMNVERLRGEVEELNVRLQRLEAGLTTLMQTWNLVGNRLLEVLLKIESKASEGATGI